ncbi:alcohol acetyltransferase-domain-containing protein [Mycena albidolilacea]|uniref:Alcohol acetyltransferase-domain-containing protein n=1 Tax=Mycena albidolilacea TaxID=1033008 RepID=A0AAD7E9J3_9AGAR|nr:alcohol acetyltransferase-domain-containing protein [Mycena albidolilacea]
MTPPVIRLRKTGLMEQYHITRHFLGMDSCIVASAQYVAQDGAALNREILFPALRTLIETHAALGLRLDGDEATEDVYLARLSMVDLSRVVEFSAKDNLQEAYESQLARGFATQTDLPLWRVQLLADNTIVFAVHHGVCDGMSLMVFLLGLLQALQNSESGDTDTSHLVQIPTSNVLFPPVEQATNVRPSLRTICSKLFDSVAPASWTKMHSAWTGLASPLTPNVTTHVRILPLPAPDIVALCAAARTQGATLTSTFYVLAVSALSQLIAQDPARYTRIGSAVAISLHGVAGIPDDVMCDYPGVFYAHPRVAPDFNWAEAGRVARVLQGQKRKGREIVGMLGFIQGKYAPYMKRQLGTKRETGFCISNVGRVQPPSVGGKWTIGRTIFGQCDVVTGAALSINMTGDPTGALNVAFTWGETSLETSFVEAFITSLQKGFGEVIGKAE